MQKIKLNLLKLTGAKRFTSKDGEDFVAIPISANHMFANERSVYLDLTAVENKDGPDQYGNEGFVALDVPKELRESGTKGNIIGNWKHLQKRTADKPAPVAKKAAPKDDLDDDPIPF